MSRIDEVTAQQVRGRKLWPILLVELHFASGLFPMWTGIGGLSWNGITWYGAGTLGSVGRIEENPEGRSSGVRLLLSGIDSDMLARAKDEDYQGRLARIYGAVLKDDMTFYSTPFQLRRGLMDVMTLTEGPECSIELTVEGRDIDARRNRVRRYTLEDQIAEYADDTAGRYISALQEATVTWAV